MWEMAGLGMFGKSLKARCFVLSLSVDEKAKREDTTHALIGLCLIWKLKNHQNDQNKIFELFEEISRDLKNYDLEFRIEELESKFSQDLSESTFNEIRELKKQKNIN